MISEIMRRNGALIGMLLVVGSSAVVAATLGVYWTVQLFRH